MILLVWFKYGPVNSLLHPNKACGMSYAFIMYVLTVAHPKNDSEPKGEEKEYDEPGHNEDTGIHSQPGLKCDNC